MYLSIKLEKYYGINHIMAISDICKDTAEEYGLKVKLMTCYNDKIDIMLSQDDADVEGSYIVETNRKLEEYIATTFGAEPKFDKIQEDIHMLEYENNVYNE